MMGASEQTGGSPVRRRRGLVRGRRARHAQAALHTAAVLVGAAAAAVGGLGLIARLLTWPVTPEVLALAALSPYLMACAAVGLVPLSCSRSWLLTGAAAVLVIACVAVEAPLWAGSGDAPGAHRVVVMTVNARLGEARADDIVAAVTRDGVDILAVQELTPQMQGDLISAGVLGALPFQATDPRAGAEGAGLWSRLAVSNVQRREDFSYAFVSADIAVAAGAAPMRFSSAHMAGPTPDATGWARDIGHLPAVLQGMPAGRPVVVAGDLNATPDIRQFRRLLRGGFEDAAIHANAGLLETYPADAAYPPLIAIDHVLTRDAHAAAVHTVKIRDTDHLALIANIALD
jgi:endonuclease/exonuclease/phosphatase family metal-dependent hydrolase